MNTPANTLEFAQVARELSAPLLRYLRRQVGNDATAEDLCQETLLRVQRALPRFTGRSSVKTWAFSIAGNVVSDYLREPARRLKVVEMDKAANVPASEVTLDERLVIDEMNSCVREVIDSLPPDYRTALILHDLEDMTLEQTAEISTCTLAAAKIRVHRARRRLKTALARQCEFYRDTENVLRCARS